MDGVWAKTVDCTASDGLARRGPVSKPQLA